jgi:hypothetical protein
VYKVVFCVYALCNVGMMSWKSVKREISAEKVKLELVLGTPCQDQQYVKGIRGDGVVSIESAPQLCRLQDTPHRFSLLENRLRGKVSGLSS